MTQVWAIIVQKGGAGKTTLSLHAAIALVGMGKAVEILDVDPQQIAARWTVQRKGRAPLCTPIVAAQIFDVLDGIRNKSDTEIVIVDTSPRADRDSQIVASAADFIIVPVRPSTLDIPAVLDTLELLDEAGHRDKTVLVLNAVAISTDEGAMAASYLRKLGWKLSPYILSERVDYRRPLLIGKGLTEAKKSGKAVTELKGLVKWLIKEANATQETNHGKKPARKAS